MFSVSLWLHYLSFRSGTKPTTAPSYPDSRSTGLRRNSAEWNREFRPCVIEHLSVERRGAVRGDASAIGSDRGGVDEIWPAGRHAETHQIAQLWIRQCAECSVVRRPVARFRVPRPWIMPPEMVPEMTENGAPLCISRMPAVFQPLIRRRAPPTPGSPLMSVPKLVGRVRLEDVGHIETGRTGFLDPSVMDVEQRFEVRLLIASDITQRLRIRVVRLNLKPRPTGCLTSNCSPL